MLVAAYAMVKYDSLILRIKLTVIGRKKITTHIVEVKLELTS